MFLRRARFLLTAVVAVISFSAQAETAPYRIGVCLALTGEAAKWSAAQRAGMELAIEETKAKGIPLDVFWFDTGTDPKSSVTCLQQMTSVHNVEGVLGNIWSFLTTPMLPIASKLKLPIVAPSYFRERCPTESDSTLISVAEQVGDLRSTFGRFFKKHPEMKKVAVLAFDDGLWGELNYQALKSALETSGLTLVDEYKTNEFRPDLKAVYPKMLKKQPDAIFIFHEPLNSTKPLRELNYKGAIVQSNAVCEQIWDTGKANPMFEGVYFTDIAHSADFRAKFKARFAKEPVLDAHSGYDSVTTLVAGLQGDRADPLKFIRENKIQGLYQEMDFSTSCVGKVSDWKLFQMKGGVPVSAE